MATELNHTDLDHFIFKDILTVEATNTKWDTTNKLLRVSFKCPICNAYGTLYSTNSAGTVAMLSTCMYSDYIITFNGAKKGGSCSSIW